MATSPASGTAENIFPELMKGIKAATSKKLTINLKPIEVKMLELDDVLYHTNSAVLMPEVPQKDASKPSKQITGLRAIALAFKQLEFDPRMSILIAAHTDTEGTPESNFELSRKRGQGIFTLMSSGMRIEWADVSCGQQAIEDYQRILKYMADHHGWSGCDPGPITNSWNSKTKQATQAFIDRYNIDTVASANPPPGAVTLDSKKLIYFIDNDYKHHWTVELWRAVYDIYVSDIAKELRVDRTVLDSRYRSKAKFLKNAFNEHYVACGESHPIDKAQKDNYRSQKNRRVEIYFFREKDVKNAWPSLWAWWFMHPCPTYGKVIHGPDVCPLWHNLFIKKVPVEEADLTSVGYHVRFVFWERKTGILCNLPDGIQIQAFSQIAEQPASNLNARVSYLEDAGAYLVKVQDDPARTHIHFSFSSIQGADASPRWAQVAIDAKKNATCTIVSENQIRQQNSNKALADLPLDKQLEYYDIPAQWSSFNYYTRYDNDFGKGGKFQDVIATTKRYKPHGPNITTPTEALVFSLDDIVLLDAVGGTQAIRDADHIAANLDTVPSVANPPHYPVLSAASRVKIFAVNESTGKLELYKTGSADNTARIRFPENYIAVKATGFVRARIVFFRDGFYTIGSKRTAASTGWENNGFALGARAAVRNDPDHHVHWEMQQFRNEYGYTGDYELHYFHRTALNGAHPVSFLIAYVSVSFMRDSRSISTAVPPTAPTTIPTVLDVNRFVDEGVYNVMAQFGKKDYYFDDEAASADSVRVQPMVFIDERETFFVDDAHQPTSIDFDQRANVPALITAIQQPRENARGGKSKFLALICEDSSPTVKYGLAYQWAIRSGQSYSLFKLNKSAFEEITNKGDLPSGLFGGDTIPQTEDGPSYGVFTFAHEVGHSIGNADEYVNDSFVIRYQVTNSAGITNTYDLTEPGIDQYFECYTMVRNQSALMFHNLIPRMHHFYYHLWALQDQIATKQLHAKNWLGGKRYEICYKQGSTVVRYSRHTKSITISPDIRVPVSHSPTNDGQHAISTAPQKNLYIAMHYIGNDEASKKWIHLNQTDEYQAVAVVRILMHITFNGLPPLPAPNATPPVPPPVIPDAYKPLRLRTITNQWNDLSCRYKLSGAHQDIKNIAVHFLPGYSGNAGQCNIQLEFFNTSQTPAIVPAAAPAGGAPAKLNVYNNATADEIIKYVLNLPAAAVLSNYASLLSNFGWISDWVRTKLGVSGASSYAVATV